MPEATTHRAVRVAREVAHAASHLASEAAALARIYEEHGAQEASVVASQASIRAARVAFRLDEEFRRRIVPGAPASTEPPDLEGAIRASLASLEAAGEAVAATKSALDAALASALRAREAGALTPGEG